MCQELARMAKAMCTVSGIPEEEIVAVGVGLPGLVDNKTGVVIKTPNMPFNNTPFRELFQQVWDIPVYLGNDANCAAIGEYFAGAAKSSNNAVVVTIGTGIGGGLVVDGKLLTGFANAGMEVGHMLIHPNGMMCGCGQRGCWEQYGSATALIRLTRIEMERNRETKLWEVCEFDMGNITGRTAFQAARMGDAAAKRVLAQYLEGLSIGLINLVNILQPEIICLGGGVSNAEDDLLLDPLRDLVAKGVFDKHVPIRLEKASLGNDAGIVGAALLCETV
jgi:glucokinase